MRYINLLMTLDIDIAMGRRLHEVCNSACTEVNLKLQGRPHTVLAVGTVYYHAV